MDAKKNPRCSRPFHSSSSFDESLSQTRLNLRINSSLDKKPLSMGPKKKGPDDRPRDYRGSLTNYFRSGEEGAAFEGVSGAACSTFCLFSPLLTSFTTASRPSPLANRNNFLTNEQEHRHPSSPDQGSQPPLMGAVPGPAVTVIHYSGGREKTFAV